MIPAAALWLSAFSCLFSGVWDLKFQIFFVSVFLVFFIYYFSENVFLNKEIEIPEGFSWAAAALVFSAVSSVISPVSSSIVSEYPVFLSAAAIYLIASGGKEKIKKSFLPFSAALVLPVFLAFWQIFFPSPESRLHFFRNYNSFAFFCMLAAGFCLENGFRVIAVIMLSGIIISGSSGVFLAGLAASAFYLYEKKDFLSSRKKRVFVFLGSSLALLALLFVPVVSFYDRLKWWEAAVRIFSARPLFGWGYGGFSAVYPAFSEHIGGLASVYAHNYYLEFLSENGLFSSILWFWFLYMSVKNSSGFYRYALFAALVHSFFDFGLSEQGNLWFFFFLAGFSAVKKNRLRIRKETAVFAFILIAALCFKWFSFSFASLAAEEKTSESLDMFSSGQREDGLCLLRKSISVFPENFLLRKVYAETLFYKASSGGSREDYFRAASALETVLVFNPYYVPAYFKLERLYSSAGERASLAELRSREKERLKWKK